MNSRQTAWTENSTAILARWDGEKKDTILIRFILPDDVNTDVVTYTHHFPAQQAILRHTLYNGVRVIFN